MHELAIKSSGTILAFLALLCIQTKSKLATIHTYSLMITADAFVSQ